MGLTRTLVKVFHKEQYDPSVLGLFINPFYFARKGLSQEMKLFSNRLGGKLLDVGCGQKPYERFFIVDMYIGLEHESARDSDGTRADVFYNGGKFPFPDMTFDSVLVNEVFEHVFNPDEFLSEIYRILKSDGMLLMSVPFIWDEHLQPRDFARYSSFGLQKLLQDHGFIVIAHRKTMNDIRVIFQLLNAYVYKKTYTGHRTLDLLLCLFFMAPLNLLGELASLVLPKNDDLYLDNVVLARK